MPNMPKAREGGLLLQSRLFQEELGGLVLRWGTWTDHETAQRVKVQKSHG